MVSWQLCLPKYPKFWTKLGTIICNHSRKVIAVEQDYVVDIENIYIGRYFECKRHLPKVRSGSVLWDYFCFHFLIWYGMINIVWNWMIFTHTRLEVFLLCFLAKNEEDQNMTESTHTVQQWYRTENNGLQYQMWHCQVWTNNNKHHYL